MTQEASALAAYKAGLKKNERKSGGGGHRSKRISLAVVAGLVPAASHAIDQLRYNSPADAAKSLLNDFTGYNAWNNQWNWQGMKRGLLPAMLGVGVHKAANKFGINRALRDAGIPWICI